ncbi:MAG: DNA-binding protein [Nostoc sp. LLA-1]|nr:DNA-binding protein [Cyanocohniella sp. LLY]
MYTKTYPLPWVKTACEHVYAKNICPRTWQKWLRICGIQPYARQACLKECCYLLGLAYLKRQNMCKKYSLFDVALLLKQDKERFASLGINVEEPELPLSGKQLPAYLFHKTRRKISLRTIYRWASKHNIPFSASKIITPEELNQWIKLGNMNL